MKRGGKVVVRAPSSLERAARELADGPAGGTLARAEKPSAVAALLTKAGAKPRLDEEAYKSAVRLHCGTDEPAIEGVRDTCPLCRGPLTQGHHRWCQALPLEPSLQHHEVRDTTAQWLGEADSIAVRTEVGMHGGTVRADVVAAARGAKVVVETKTADVRSKAYTRKDLAKRSAELEEEIADHYGAGVADPLILDAAGRYTRTTAATLDRLQAMRAHVAPELADGTTLLVELGAACARVEAASHATWADCCEAAVLAKQLSRAGPKRGAARPPMVCATPRTPPAVSRAAAEGAPSRADQLMVRAGAQRAAQTAVTQAAEPAAPLSHPITRSRVCGQTVQQAKCAAVSWARGCAWRGNRLGGGWRPTGGASGMVSGKGRRKGHGSF